MQLFFQKVTEGGEKDLREQWTGELVGRMHNAQVTLDDMAAEMHCTKSYVSQILNGRRKPENAQERLENAFKSIVDKKSD